MVSMNHGRTGLAGGERGRGGHAWSPELAAVLIAAAVLLGLVV